jgi:hypothetical protein
MTEVAEKEPKDSDHALMAKHGIEFRDHMLVVNGGQFPLDEIDWFAVSVDALPRFPGGGAAFVFLIIPAILWGIDGLFFSLDSFWYLAMAALIGTLAGWLTNLPGAFEFRSVSLDLRINGKVVSALQFPGVPLSAIKATEKTLSSALLTDKRPAVSEPT